jgi:Na+/H+-dicarboxylate symporter
MVIYRKWKALNIFTKVMFGFVLGIILGLVLGPQATALEFLGTILIRLLSMVVAPLVLCMLICAAADVGSRSLGKIGVMTTLFFTLSTAVAISTGLIFAYLFNVGGGFMMELETVAEAGNVAVPSMIDTLVAIVPNNIFAALTNATLLQIMFFSMFFGIALTKLKDKEKAEVVINLFRTGSDAMKQIIGMVLNFTPIGVMGIMAWVVGQHGISVLLPFGRMILATYVACLFYILFIQSFLFVKVLGKTSPFTFIKTMKDAAVFAFATCSSVATMPLTLAATKKMGVSDKVANFTIPYGTVINLDGSAIYQSIAVVFAAQIFGIELGVTEILLIVVSATLASIGTAGVPGSALVMLTIVLAAVNLPLEVIGLLAGIDRILNMARVVPNVIGDAAVSIIVARRHGEMVEPGQVTIEEKSDEITPAQ